MKDPEQFSQFLPKEKLNPDQLTFERPEVLPTPDHERVPSAYDPMGHIQLSGRDSGIGSVSSPWWVLFTSWVIFGGLVFLILIPIVISEAWSLLPVLVIAILLFVKVIRGTREKLLRRNDSH